jgi:hypothetical protein
VAPDALTSDGKGYMGLVAAVGEPGHIRVRFAASQREAITSELQLVQSSSAETLEMVARRDDTNPAFVTFKEDDLAAVEALLSELATVPEGEDFTLTGDAGILYSCIQGAAGIAAEQYMTHVDELRAGPEHKEAVEDLQEALAATTLWAWSLMAAQPFEPARKPPPQLLPAEPADPASK